MLISKRKTLEEVDNSNNDISIVIFFNLPEVHSYKAACVFISNILNCIRNNNIKDMTASYFIIWISKTVPYAKSFSRNRIITKADIISIVTLFFPEKKYDDIEKELFADDNALLNKLLRCFGTYNGNYEMMSGSPQ